MYHPFIRRYVDCHWKKVLLNKLKPHKQTEKVFLWVSFKIKQSKILLSLSVDSLIQCYKRLLSFTTEIVINVEVIVWMWWID
jgi:hypothetical protein